MQRKPYYYIDNEFYHPHIIGGNLVFTIYVTWPDGEQALNKEMGNRTERGRPQNSMAREEGPPMEQPPLHPRPPGSKIDYSLLSIGPGGI